MKLINIDPKNILNIFHWKNIFEGLVSTEDNKVEYDVSEFINDILNITKYTFMSTKHKVAIPFNIIDVKDEGLTLFYIASPNDEVNKSFTNQIGTIKPDCSNMNTIDPIKIIEQGGVGDRDFVLYNNEMYFF